MIFALIYREYIILVKKRISPSLLKDDRYNHLLNFYQSKFEKGL